jgi:acetyl esterase/lipase
MAVYYEHAGKVFSSVVAEKSATGAMNERMMNAIGLKMDTPAHWQPGTTVQDSMMRALLGGTPDEAPEAYRQASPITYAGPHCPPTLLMQGEHDAVVSAEAVRAMAEKLCAAGVKVVHVEYPQTEHAFDLVPWGVPTQASWYETERFLALLALKPVVAPVAPGVNGEAVDPTTHIRPIAQPVPA